MNTNQGSYPRTAGKRRSGGDAWKVIAGLLAVLGGAVLLGQILNAVGFDGLLTFLLIIGLPALGLYWIIRLAVSHGMKR